jgi:hypothetical protein
MSRRALAIINMAGLAGDVLMTKHARIEAAAAGFLIADVHHALAVATDAVQREDGSWRVTSTSMDDEPMGLAVAISLDDQTKVVTVWRIE